MSSRSARTGIGTGVRIGIGRAGFPPATNRPVRRRTARPRDAGLLGAACVLVTSLSLAVTRPSANGTVSAVPASTRPSLGTAVTPPPSATRPSAGASVTGPLVEPVTRNGVRPDATPPVPSVPATTDLVLALVDQSFNVTSPAALHLEYTLTNPPAALLDPASGTDATIEVAVHPAVGSAADLDGVIAGDAPEATDLVSLPAGPHLDTSAGPVASMTLDVPTTSASDAADSADAADSLHVDGPGVYPISTTIVLDGNTIAHHQTFIRVVDAAGDPGAPLTVSVVAGVDDPGPDPSTEQLDDGIASLRRLDELGQAVAEPLTVAIPPGLLEHAAASEPELAAELAATLDGDELFAVPAESVDPSALAAIDAVDTFTAALNDGEDVFARVLPGTSVRRTAWLAGRDLSEPGASLLRDLGVRLIVMSADLYSALPGNIGVYVDTTSMIEIAVGARRLDGVVVHGYDDLIGTDPDIRTPVERAVELLARLFVTRQELGADRARAVVLSTSDLGVPDPAVLGVVDGIALDDPTLIVRPLSYLPNSTSVMEVNDAPSTVDLPDTAGQDLTVRSAEIGEVRAMVDGILGMLDGADPRRTSWYAELNRLLSTAYTDDDVRTHLDAITTEVERLRTSVELPAPFDLTLTGRSNVLRFRLTNTSDLPLTVVVRPRSSKLEFPDGDPTVTLIPHDATEVEIPVVARANGRSPMSISVFSPSGTLVGTPLVLTATVRTMAGLGQVITGGALAVLASWWASHVIRRRRQRRPAAPVDATGEFLRSPDAEEALADEAFRDERDVDETDSVTPL